MKSDNKMQHIAVLLTCFNRKEQTITCLKHLFLNKLPLHINLDVFLVDDGSTDGTSEVVKKQFPTVTIIKGTGELYWNRGMNLAWKTAVKQNMFDYFIWLNDDVVLFEDAIVTILEASKEKKDAIISGVMQSELGEVITYGGRNKDGDLIVPNGQIQESYLFNGNLVCIPKTVYQKIGNLDPLFSHSIGDFDYGLRAAKEGIKNYITPNYSGYCEKHSKPPIWCLESVSLKKRLKNLYSPLGNSHPYYYFRYTFRHFGLIIALKHLFSIHLRVLIPSLWK